MDKKQKLKAVADGKHGRAEDTLAYWSKMTGWDTVTDLELACQFITESGGQEAFAAFLRAASHKDRSRYGAPEGYCDECGEDMPPTAEFVNDKHLTSCSLYEAGN